MLKHLRKRIKQRKLSKARLLACALTTAAVLATSPAAWAYGVGITGAITTLTNTGTISGTDAGIYNAGTIGSASDSSSGLFNYGTISATGSGTGSISGIYNAGAITTLTNTGSISGTNTGTGAECGIENSGGSISTLTNSGTISGTTSGITNRPSGAITTLTNTGAIISTSGSGIFNYGTITTITNPGTITGALTGIFVGAGGAIGTITNTGTISSDGYWIYVDSNASADVVSESGGKLCGATYVSSSGSTLNLTLNNSTWTVAGDSSLTSLTLSGGGVKVAASGAYYNITARTLSGSGSFYLNSNLAAGTSDVITVTGTASGSYKLYITNTGGSPSAGQYVKVVDLTSGSTATFSGGGDAGAYYYGVAKGSAISGTLAGEDYYFYIAPSSVSLAAIGLTAGNSVMWYGEMNEIKKRMGELRMGHQSSDDVWARTYAEKFSVRPAGGESYEQIIRGVEIGKDNPQAFNGGKKYTGFVLGTGKATDNFTDGSGTAYSTYLGAYASWLRDDGTYFDLIGKYNWFSHSFATASDSGSYYNRGLGLSAEIGKRFQRGNGYFVEPALELAALWSNHAAYTTDNGLAVSVPSSRSLQLRLGCTVGRKWQGADGAQREFYGKAGWVNEYAGDSTTTVDSAAFDSSIKGHQWVTSLGYVEDTKKHQVYVDLEKSWGNTTSKEWGLNVGYRWKF